MFILFWFSFCHLGQKCTVVWSQYIQYIRQSVWEEMDSQHFNQHFSVNNSQITLQTEKSVYIKQCFAVVFNAETSEAQTVQLNTNYDLVYSKGVNAAFACFNYWATILFW